MHRDKGTGKLTAALFINLKMVSDCGTCQEGSRTHFVLCSCMETARSVCTDPGNRPSLLLRGTGSCQNRMYRRTLLLFKKFLRSMGGAEREGEREGEAHIYPVHSGCSRVALSPTCPGMHSRPCPSAGLGSLLHTAVTIGRLPLTGMNAPSYFCPHRGLAQNLVH